MFKTGFLNSSKDTIFGTAFAAGATTWLYLQKYIIIQIRKGQTGKLNWDMIRTTSVASFKSLRVALITDIFFSEYKLFFIHYHGGGDGVKGTLQLKIQCYGSASC